MVGFSQAGGGPPGAHLGRDSNRKSCALSASIGTSHADQASSWQSLSASYSTLQPNGLATYQNRFSLCGVSIRNGPWWSDDPAGRSHDARPANIGEPE